MIGGECVCERVLQSEEIREASTKMRMCYASDKRQQESLELLVDRESWKGKLLW